MTLLLAWLACTPTPPAELQPVLAAAGADDLDALHTLEFTFKVTKDGEVKAVRGWRWDRVRSRVTRSVDGETLEFTPGAPMDEAETQADAQWQNDSFWLSPPMHLSWTQEVQVESEGACTHPTAPDTERRCLMVRYPATGGGYTPGDAYRLYLDQDSRIAAWDYLKGGAEPPAVAVDFSDYVQAGPLQVATHHESADGRFELELSGVKGD